MSYKQPIFTPDRIYRVLRTFTSTNFTFEKDETLVFLRDYYSIYDSCFVYAFRDIVSGEEKEWWLPQDQPKDQWVELFEQVLPAPLK